MGLVIQVWVMQGCSGSYRGKVRGHTGVMWVMQGWGGSCRGGVGHAEEGLGGLCRGGTYRGGVGYVGVG